MQYPIELPTNGKKKHHALQSLVFLHDRKYIHTGAVVTLIERAPCYVHAERFRRVRLLTVELAAAERGSEHTIITETRRSRKRKRAV